MFEFIKGLINKIKNFFKNKIAPLIIQFVQHVIGFFKKDKNKLRLQENKALLATTIKEKLANGDYAVSSVLFDQVECEIIEKEEGQLAESQQMDAELTEELNSNGGLLFL